MSGSVLDGNDPFSIANGIFPNGLVNAGERAPGVRTSTDTRSHNVSDLLDPAGGGKDLYIYFRLRLYIRASSWQAIHV